MLRRQCRETPERPETHVMFRLKRGDAANDSIKMRNERDKRRQTPNTALFALNRYVNPWCRAALVASRDHHVKPPRGCLLLTLMSRCCCCCGAPRGDAQWLQVWRGWEGAGRVLQRLVAPPDEGRRIVLHAAPRNCVHNLENNKGNFCIDVTDCFAIAILSSRAPPRPALASRCRQHPCRRGYTRTFVP